MAKSAGDNSGSKAQSKSTGRQSALARSAARASSRSGSPKSSQAVRGSVSKKPRGRWMTFLSEVRIELTKVTWPTRKELIQSTGVVIVLVIIAGIYIGAFDAIWNVIIQAVGLS